MKNHEIGPILKKSKFSEAKIVNASRICMGHFGRLEAHEQSKGATSIYSLDMQYNQAGGITFKNSNGSGFMNASALTYNLEYTYVGKKYHQLDQVWDPTNGILTKFKYNTTGSVTQIDDSSQLVVQDFFWNEQQQLGG